MEDPFTQHESRMLMDEKLRRKKLFMYLFRSAIMIFLFVALWDFNDWIPYLLLIYVPLNLLSIAPVLGWNYWLKKRWEKLRNQ